MKYDLRPVISLWYVYLTRCSLRLCLELLILLTGIIVVLFYIQKNKKYIKLHKIAKKLHKLNLTPHLPINHPCCQLSINTIHYILNIVWCLLSVVCCLLSINTKHLSNEIPRTLKFICSSMFLFTKFNINIISESGGGERLL